MAIGLEYAQSKGLDLYRFQRDGVELMKEMVDARVRENGDGHGGVLVFDEMGLGKTMEAIAYLAEMDPQPRRVLVVCPNTLKLEWKAALERWLPEEQLFVVATGRGGLKRFKELEDERWMTRTTRVLITNYETFRSKDYLDILKAFSPQLAIWDEAHRLRNWERKTARATREVSGTVELLLTGYPVVNHAGDLWSLVSRVSPKLAGSAVSWEDTFTTVRRGSYGVSKFGVRNSGMLRTILDKVSIQRKKEEVLKDLPPKIIREVPLLMEPEQRQIYGEMETQLFILLDEEGATLQTASVLALLMRLRQLCCDPRILHVERSTPVPVGVSWVDEGLELYSGRQATRAELLDVEGEVLRDPPHGVGGIKTEFLLELIEDLEDSQLVVFTNFEQYISLIAGLLSEKGISYTRLTGKETGDTRALNIQKFQRGEAQVLLGTTQAGGEGVNLQVASKVVLLDRWWSPARNEQAIARLHRIGQESPVEVFLPHCVDSIDDALRETLDRKLSIVNELRIQGDTVEKLRQYRERRQSV